ncbi:MAG: hypothetical protein ACJAT2_002192 [Bacteriovoracaceae bacterium]|jgi:hypothetical protein
MEKETTVEVTQEEKGPGGSKTGIYVIMFLSFLIMTAIIVSAYLDHL